MDLGNTPLIPVWKARAAWSLWLFGRGLKVVWNIGRGVFYLFSSLVFLVLFHRRLSDKCYLLSLKCFHEDLL